MLCVYGCVYAHLEEVAQPWHSVLRTGVGSLDVVGQLEDQSGGILLTGQHHLPIDNHHSVVPIVVAVGGARRMPTTLPESPPHMLCISVWASVADLEQLEVV